MQTELTLAMCKAIKNVPFVSVDFANSTKKFIDFRNGEVIVVTYDSAGYYTTAEFYKSSVESTPYRVMRRQVPIGFTNPDYGSGLF